MKVKVTGVNQLNDKDVIRGFITVAESGLSNKDEINDRMEYVVNKLSESNEWVAEYEFALQVLDGSYKDTDPELTAKMFEQYKSYENAFDLYRDAAEERNFWNSAIAKLEKALDKYKNFNKTVCFSNIRELLKQNSDVKIGQIEKEARVRLGYMSRLEKEGNVSEPNIEFIMSAAKLLKISLDTLLYVDLKSLTPTEQYLVKFFDKLKEDTNKDKLDWNKETAMDLNSMEPNDYGYCDHPLFSFETFSEESESGYPEEITRITYKSKSYGLRTTIHNDCFNLRLKNGATLYLMDISKSVYRTTDPEAYAKEVVMFVPNNGYQYLVTSMDKTPIADLLDGLFNTVKERMEHPKVKKEVMGAIDAFMIDDFDDDPCDMNF